MSDIAKQWGENGNENEQTEPDNVADENAVVTQALLNDVWKLVEYMPAKKMQKVPDPLIHWKQWSWKELNTVIIGHLKNLNMFPHSVSPKLRREIT